MELRMTGAEARVPSLLGGGFLRSRFSSGFGGFSLLARFGLHLHAYACRDFAVQTNRHRVVAEILQRLAELNFPAIHFKAVGGELSGDIGRGDRTEEVALLAGFAGKAERQRFYFGYEHFRLGLFSRRPALGGGLHLLDDGLVRFSSLHGQLARQQVIAAVAIGNLHDFSAKAQVGDVFSQNDFHGDSPMLSAASGAYWLRRFCPAAVSRSCADTSHEAKGPRNLWQHRTGLKPDLRKLQLSAAWQTEAELCCGPA